MNKIEFQKRLEPLTPASRRSLLRSVALGIAGYALLCLLVAGSYVAALRLAGRL